MICRSMAIRFYPGIFLDKGYSSADFVLLTEIKTLLDTVEKNVDLDVLWPAIPSDLNEPYPPHILHLSCTGNGSEIELQDEFGATIRKPVRQIITAMQDSPELIIFDGPNTEEIGAETNTTLGTSVICLSGDISSEFRTRFMSSLYLDLSNGVSLQVAVNNGNRLMGCASPSSHYIFLAGRTNSFEINPGSLVVSPRFQTLSNMDMSKLDQPSSRRNLLINVARAATSSQKGVVLTAPSGFGLTTMLQSFAEYYSWLGNSVTRFVGDDSAYDGGSILDKIDNDSATLLIIDDFECIAPALQSRIIELAVSANSNVQHIVIGTHLESIDTNLVHLEVAPFSQEESRNFLSAGLGEQIDRFQHLPSMLPGSPSDLLAIIDRVRKGASFGEIQSLIDSGELKDDTHTAVERAWREPLLRIALGCVTRYPGLEKTCFRDAWAKATKIPREEIENSFQHTLNSLVNRRLIELRHRSEPSNATSVYCAPEIATAVRRKGKDLSPSQSESIRRFLLEHLATYSPFNPLYVGDDLVWIEGLMKECLKARADYETVLKLIYPHLREGGGMRVKLGITELKPVIARAHEIAKYVQSSDITDLVALMYGEIHYREGDLGGAHDIFQEIARFSESPQRKLQSYRALGQVAYRQGQFPEALEWFKQGEKISTNTQDRYFTTLLQEKGKTLARLGDVEQAVPLLREVVKRREEELDCIKEPSTTQSCATGHTLEAAERSVFRAQHELARALEGMLSFPEAEELFLAAYEGSSSLGDHRHAIGSLFHLLTLALAQDDIPRAERRLADLKSLSELIEDRLWIINSSCAEGMVHFSKRQFDQAYTWFKKGFDQANDLSFHPTIHDVRKWLRRKSHQLYAEFSSDTPPAGLIDVLSLTFQLPHHKVVKAIGYASKPDTISSITTVFKSNHGIRNLEWRPGAGWRCSCDLFINIHNCSHIAAIMLRNISLPDHLPKERHE